MSGKVVEYDTPELKSFLVKREVRNRLKYAFRFLRVAHIHLATCRRSERAYLDDVSLLKMFSSMLDVDAGNELARVLRSCENGVRELVSSTFVLRDDDNSSGGSFLVPTLGMESVSY